MWQTRYLEGSEEGRNPNPKVPKQVNFIWGVKIPMRDGTQLSATVYKPKDGKPVPAIFTLTPYIADGAHLDGVYFAG